LTSGFTSLGKADLHWQLHMTGFPLASWWIAATLFLMTWDELNAVLSYDVLPTILFSLFIVPPTQECKHANSPV
jgi:hypothetical protein